LKVVKLVYAGAMSSKDYIDTLIQAIMHINKDKIRITFDVIGPEKVQLEKLVATNELEKLGIEEGDTVRMYGLEFDYYK